MSSPPLSCIACRKPLEPAFKNQDMPGDAPNKPSQPYNALVFVAHGNYGSTCFDPLPFSGTVQRYLEVNICDTCVLMAAAADPPRLVHVTQIQRMPDVSYKNYEGTSDG